MNSLSIALLLFCVVGYVVSSSCPNDCSGHGDCKSSVCDCETSYSGDDCSIYNETLSSGKKAEDSVPVHEWKYYNIQVQPQRSMLWWMNRTTSSETDCDLYIQQGSLPALNSFLTRNISMSADLSLEVPTDDGGLFYAGVYGFKGCDYKIQVDIANECNCNSHGDCVEGQCQCNTGYYGDECENEVKVMLPEQQYTDSVEFQKYSYYSYTATSVVDEVDWILTKTGSSSEDCDLYVMAGDLPTLWSWDYANITIGTEKIIAQSEVIVGSTNYLGVYGYSRSDCHFNIKIHVTTPSAPSECPNNCSYHSTSCENSVCQCMEGFSGAECETYDQFVSLASPYTGYVGANAWNYFKINGDEAAGFLVTLDRTSSFGDCDLYIKAGEKPSRFDFDYLDITTDASMSVTLPNPEGNDWWVGIYGFYAAEYILQVDSSEECQCVSADHGYCNSGSTVCNCNANFAGEDCGSPVVPLSSGVAMKGESVFGHQWNYYSISSESASAFSLSIREASTEGMVWVFVSHNEPPSLVDYDFSNKDQDSIHQITYATQEEESGTLFIGVYGSPYLPDVTIDGTGTEAVYDIACWVSDF